MQKYSDVEAIRWDDDRGILQLLDQTQLPGHIAILDCVTVEDAWEAIVRLSVRGAPAIGIAAAYAVCLSLPRYRNEPAATSLSNVYSAIDYLATSRPTAVNLFWALDRMRRIADAFADLIENEPQDKNASFESHLRSRFIQEARAIHAEDCKLCESIGRHGAKRLAGKSRFLTHCNAGALATGGMGTALAPIYHLHRSGVKVSVFADETRPLLQGARLTAWELSRAGVPVTIITDSTAGTILRDGKVDAVIVGADRITRRGDVANKIGTYPLAILARHHGIPFFVAAPWSTFDLEMLDGGEIPIEQRAASEITNASGWSQIDSAVQVYNPAFDVTPASLVTAIITDAGVIEEPNESNIEALLISK